MLCSSVFFTSILYSGHKFCRRLPMTQFRIQKMYIEKEIFSYSRNGNYTKKTISCLFKTCVVWTLRKLKIFSQHVCCLQSLVKKIYSFISSATVGSCKKLRANNVSVCQSVSDSCFMRSEHILVCFLGTAPGYKMIILSYKYVFKTSDPLLA